MVTGARDQKSLVIRTSGRKYSTPKHAFKYAKINFNYTSDFKVPHKKEKKCMFFKTNRKSLRSFKVSELFV